ncbi:hypothetical protein DCO45_01965 [Comamonas sp. JNW]|nr:hypothetical protein DCO45_01965 [Comamonas sp. JNW]
MQIGDFLVAGLRLLQRHQKACCRIENGARIAIVAEEKHAACERRAGGQKVVVAGVRIIEHIAAQLLDQRVVGELLGVFQHFTGCKQLWMEREKGRSGLDVVLKQIALFFCCGHGRILG